MSLVPRPQDFEPSSNTPIDPVSKAVSPQHMSRMPHQSLPLPYAEREAPAAPVASSQPPTPPMPRSGFHQDVPTRPAFQSGRDEQPLVSPARPRKRYQRNWGRVLGIVVLVGALLFLLIGGLAAHRFSDFGQAISKQAPFSTQTNYMSGSGRINVLVLGYGGTGHDGALLTDSMIVISLIPADHATTIISVPRDLWVQVPPNSGQYAKINTAYQDGYYNGYNGIPAGRDAGGSEAAGKVGVVLGLPINYWLTMDFDGFRSLVDALGGVDINVPTAFTAQYPANDDPSINPNWKIIHFSTGLQHMDGERAIEYARARYVLTPLSQGSDFARSVRQQLLISAILSRARQVSAWPGLLDATNALQNAIYTNLSLADLALFAQKLNFSDATHIGLSEQNVLAASQSSDGQDILLPANGDWSAIQKYVISNLQS